MLSLIERYTTRFATWLSHGRRAAIALRIVAIAMAGHGLVVLLISPATYAAIGVGMGLVFVWLCREVAKTAPPAPAEELKLFGRAVPERGKWALFVVMVLVTVVAWPLAATLVAIALAAYWQQRREIAEQ